MHARADGPGGWLFRGKRIAAAVASRLLGELGLDAGSQVLLTGDSAGGVGCLNNADWLHDMLQCALCPANPVGHADAREPALHRGSSSKGCERMHLRVTEQLLVVLVQNNRVMRSGSWYFCFGWIDGRTAPTYYTLPTQSACSCMAVTRGKALVLESAVQSLTGLAHQLLTSSQYLSRPCVPV